MTDRDQLVGQVVDCLREVAHGIAAITMPDWLQLDLTMAQLKGLFTLANADRPMTVGGLAQGLRIQLPGASHVADRLVQLGLAERYEDPEDRRRTLLRPSSRGRGLAQQLRQGREDRIKGWLAALSEDDLVALHRGFRALAAAVSDRSTPEGIRCGQDADRDIRLKPEEV